MAIARLRTVRIYGKINRFADIFNKYIAGREIHIDDTISLTENINNSEIYKKDYFYINGWMEEKDADLLEKEINNSSDGVIFFNTPPDKKKKTPVKLKNNFIFKPFEMFVRMYGMPDYYDIDPTPLIAVTYILFFGIMFGDVGQSLVFAVIGFLLYKIKKWDIAAIIGSVGVSGMIFGFVYGSFFGNEEIIPGIFGTEHLHPMKQIGVMLGATIGIGIMVIIFCMLLNIINSIKNKRVSECLFSENGVAGIVLYLSSLGLIAKMFLKLKISNTIFVLLIVLALFLIYLKIPLGKLVKGEKQWLPQNGLFFVESLFEIFEVILSFFSNTISFLRIGAFAIVHTGMMTVIKVLSGDGGVGAIIVQIIGNIIVMGLEGLIVGIQVLRLEYYEMFSRYYKGEGMEFSAVKYKMSEGRK